MALAGVALPSISEAKGLKSWPGFCRDCLSDASEAPCPHCGSTRVVSHPELNSLSIAHIDCDAFYAAIEKRDDPSLNDKPLIVGGEVRGVVSTACYIARTFGVRSAMPMFQAKRLCPHAVILKPRHSYYSHVARQIRGFMEELTPLVEPLSLDEAYLDLSGTARIHHRSPARTMASLSLRIEREIGITVSVGLSGNKFLAKLASELDKPRGFAVIGMAEARSFLRDKKVGIMRGAGKVLQAKLERDGIMTIGQLQDADPKELADRYGATGLWLYRMANAQDSRKVDPDGEMKTISSETTFDKDLIRLCRTGRHTVAAGRTGQRPRQGKGIGRQDYRAETQDRRFPSAHPLGFAGCADPVGRPHLPHRANGALKREADGTRFRLLGVGLSNLCPAAGADPASLIDTQSDKRAAAERAMDKIRAKFGGEAVGTGRSHSKSRASELGLRPPASHRA